ncbi:ATP-binding cassette domain-containing protein [Listeria monocytogenes]
MLKTEHISFQYEDGKQALTDVSIDLEKGNIIGLIGANGSGKSTLFMQLLGINKPTAVLTNGETSSVFLEKSNIEQAGLVQPWLIKLHQQAGYPLFKKEADFFAHTGKVTN